MDNARYELPNLLRARAEARTCDNAAPLTVAGMTSIYDPTEIEARLADEALLRNEALRALYGKMKRAGDMRYIVKPTSLSSLDELYASCPNFTAVIDDVKKQLAL